MLLAGSVLLIFPRFIGEYYLHIFSMILLYAYLGMAWNILGGYAGQFSFGHAAFFGIGAFTSTLLQIHCGVNPWIGILLAGIAGLLLGLSIGYLSFRYGLRGPYFALTMLALAEMSKLIAVEWMSIKYPLGILIPIKGDSFWNFQFINNKVPFYYIIVFMLAGIFILTYTIERKWVGFYFRAIRDNESAAEAIGINAFRYKLLAMAISASLTAMGGTFYAQYFLNIDEESAFAVTVSIEILLGPIIGGAGTVFGPILGAGVLECLSELTRSFLGSYHLMVYGSVLIFCIIFLPNGILGVLQMTFRKISKTGLRRIL